MASSDNDRTFKKEVMKVVEDSELISGSDIFEDINILLPSAVRQLSLGQRFGHLDVFKQPLRLVTTDDKMNLQFDESVLDQISQIDVPVCVIGVCGVYRTGKSYLMNKLAQKRTGFSIGSSNHSETKGIWVWCMPHPKGHDQVVVLLDTEGLSDPDKGNDEHDTKLFSLTMLMSSALIYNMKGVIDQDALKRLSIITKVTQTVSVAGSTFSNEKEDKISLQIIAPHFLFCLRDFFYELVEESSDEYMESCLKETPDKQTDDYNEIRISIKTFFPKRKCFVMSQPAMNKNLRKLETLHDDQLDADFKKDFENMLSFIHDLGPKCLDEVTRKPMDGNAFDTFLRSYIRELSKGEKMVHGDAMQTASKYHNIKLVGKICQQYQAKLDEFMLPVQSRLELLDLAMKHMYDLLQDFRRDAYPYLVNQFEEKATDKMKKMMENLDAENARKVNRLFCKYLNTEHEEMIHANNFTYTSTDGIQKYEKDFNELLGKFNKKFADYGISERCKALQKFKDDSKENFFGQKHQIAKLQEEINKCEELQKGKMFDMVYFMRKEMEKLKKDQEKKLQEELDTYKNRMSEMSFGNIGFFKRLKFLITGKIDAN